MNKLVLSTIFLLLAIISCKTNDPVATEDPGKGYSKLIFEYLDGTFEETAIKSVSYSPGNLRTTATNLIVDGDMTIINGSYDNVIIKSGDLRIKGAVSTLNLSYENTSLSKIIIERDARFFINSSYNANTRSQLTNYGEFATASVELQSAKSEIINHNRHDINGDLQLINDGAYYENRGIVEVRNFTNISAGQFKLIDCAALLTGGFNINAPKKVIGKGHIKVTGNATINHQLTESCDITICATGDIPPAKLGAAVRDCNPTCIPPSLPVTIYNLDIAQTGPDELSVKFNVTENTNLNVMKVLYSTDAKTWRVVSIVHPEDLIVGEQFKGVFSMKEK